LQDIRIICSSISAQVSTASPHHPIQGFGSGLLRTCVYRAVDSLPRTDVISCDREGSMSFHFSPTAKRRCAISTRLLFVLAFLLQGWLFLQRGRFDNRHGRTIRRLFPANPFYGDTLFLQLLNLLSWQRHDHLNGGWNTSGL
jgi:hypothetical protein